MFSPRHTLRALWRASPTFSSRRSSMSLFYRPGCAGANRRRPEKCLSWMNVASGRLAQLSLLHAEPPGLPQVSIQLAIAEPWGPRLCRRRVAPPLRSKSACAGPAAVRTALPGPVASSCSSYRASKDKRDPHTTQLSPRCTPLYTAPSSVWTVKELPPGAIRQGVQGLTCYSWTRELPMLTRR